MNAQSLARDTRAFRPQVLVGARQRVLLIDADERHTREATRHLEKAGYDVIVSGAGAPGMRNACAAAPDLIIVDIALPDVDGLQLVTALRGQLALVPILVVTGRGDEVSSVLSFRAGADDFVAKPVGFLELVARVEARLRVRGGAPLRELLRFGDIELDASAHTVRKGDRLVTLRPLEFAILRELARRPGVVVSRRQLLERLRVRTRIADSRTIDTHMVELRRKLEDDPARPRHLITVRKAGYRLDR